MSGTIVRATCPDCGDVELRPDQVRLTDGPRPWYSFGCDHCGATVHKRATPEAVALLRSGGVAVEHVPAEVWEDHPREPLTLDYAIELHADVERLGVGA